MKTIIITLQRYNTKNHSIALPTPIGIRGPKALLAAVIGKKNEECNDQDNNDHFSNDITDNHSSALPTSNSGPESVASSSSNKT